MAVRDHRLIIDPSNARQVARGIVPVGARVWGPDIQSVMLYIDDEEAGPMSAADDGGTWQEDWDTTKASDGPHRLAATARGMDGRIAQDQIIALSNQAGMHRPPLPRTLDYENVLGAWPETHIPGTQLGPNENGRHWPSARHREMDAR